MNNAVRYLTFEFGHSLESFCFDRNTFVVQENVDKLEESSVHKILSVRSCSRINNKVSLQSRLTIKSFDYGQGLQLDLLAIKL